MWGIRSQSGKPQNQLYLYNNRILNKLCLILFDGILSDICSYGMIPACNRESSNSMICMRRASAAAGPGPHIDMLTNATTALIFERLAAMLAIQILEGTIIAGAMQLAETQARLATALS